MEHVKPICVIYFPDLFEAQNRQWIYEYMRYLNGEQSDGSNKWDDRKDYWSNYYWFCFYKQDITEPELKVFHPKDFTDIQFQELKDMVLTELEKINQ
ncbi:MAG: hypothetical protein V4538_17355 [Bacteroidota bacterium]